jgi:hypothetical protein
MQTCTHSAGVIGFFDVAGFDAVGKPDRAGLSLVGIVVCVSEVCFLCGKIILLAWIQ